MKPYYSIADLANLLDDQYARVADALIASGVPLIYEGKAADISRWERIRPPTYNSNGAQVIYVMTGGQDPLPSPEAVVVSAEALPESWISQLKALDGNEGLHGNEGTAIRVSNNTLIATIAALLASWPSGSKNLPTGKDLERAAQSVGISISDDSIRKALKAAREIAPSLPA